MARKKQSEAEVILDSFEGSRDSTAFSQFTDEEYVGYVTGVVKLQNLSLNASVVDILKETRRLLKEGEL